MLSRQANPGVMQAVISKLLADMSAVQYTSLGVILYNGLTDGTKVLRHVTHRDVTR